MQIGEGTTHCADSEELDQHQQIRLMPMKSARQILLGVTLAAVVMAAASSAQAQIQTNGTPGSPGATTTISGKQLPPPDPR